MSTQLNALNLIAPKVLEAYGAEGKRLNFNDVYHSTHVNVQVPHFVGMLDGQAVTVRWTNGRYKYDTDTLIVGTPGPLNFRIPRLEVIDSIGSLVTVNYGVRMSPGAPLIISKSLSLNVDQQMFDLSEPRLSGDRKNVTVKFLNMTSPYSIRVRWHGVVVRDTESQPIQNSSSMAFSIPAGWITENAGKVVLINYSVHRSGSNDNLMFSRVLRVIL
ncbi:hypothetical protein [Pseudomonas sp. SC3(2021)]|uniref:hypothetical protein n=1 Tax=Pseudomonas sp. SC3(2021) TaxID=2871493 RepID=UPI001C9E18E2|nr:hypothetical protein [Pseudomonas sp. SC3(2021)]